MLMKYQKRLNIFTYNSLLIHIQCVFLSLAKNILSNSEALCVADKECYEQSWTCALRFITNIDYPLKK